MLKKKEMVYYFGFCKNCFGFCVSLSLLSYPANAKVLMNFSTLLPFEAYIWNWVRRSDDSLPFIRHSDLAVMGWPRCNFSSEKHSPRCHIATSGYFENIQMPFLLQLSPHEEMPLLLPSSSYFLSVSGGSPSSRPLCYLPASQPLYLGQHFHTNTEETLSPCPLHVQPCRSPPESCSSRPVLVTPYWATLGFHLISLPPSGFHVCL